MQSPSLSEDQAPLLPSSHLNALSQEVLARAKAEGCDLRSMSLLLSAVIISGVAVVVFYKPNMVAGRVFASQVTAFYLPEEYLQAPLVTGSISTNFIVNAYFSYDIPDTIIDSLRAIPWLWKKRSVLADINYEDLSRREIIYIASKEFLFLVLKSIPVILSTAQMVALGMESDLAEWLLFSQLMANVLMHWSSVTDFVENGLKTAWKTLKDCSPCKNPEKELQRLNLQNQKAILLTYKKTINDALYKLRFYLEHTQNQRQNCDDLEAALLERNSSLTELKTIYPLLNENKSFELQIALLMLANEQNLPNKKNPGLELFFINMVNFLLINLCYLGYDVMVYRETAKYSPFNLVTNIFLAAIFTFPLNYLISCMIAPSNARKLWDFMANGVQEKSVAYQRYPTTFIILFGFLFVMALFSFGTTLLLNTQYLPNKYVKDPSSLLAVNIISIIYNTYFNAFPIPTVVPAFTLPLWKLINWVTCVSQDDYLIAAQKEVVLENFLMGLARSSQFLTPKGFLCALLELDETTIRLLMGNQDPKEILSGNDFSNKDWKNSIQFLSNNHNFFVEKNKKDSSSCGFCFTHKS